MPRLVRRLAWAGIALVCLASTCQAEDRPMTVDDIVSTEAFGRASFSPDGRWAVYEKRGKYDAAPRYDLGPRSQWATTELWRVDLSKQAAPEPLVREGGGGIVRGPWSPSGRKMLVYRLLDDRLEIGVVAVADRRVVWTGLAAEIPPTGAAAEWIADDKILLMVRPDGGLPWIMRYYGASQQASLSEWAKAKAGRVPSQTAIETGHGVVATEDGAPEQALLLLNLDTGAQTVLARGQLHDFTLSPDGTHVAIVDGASVSPVELGSVIQADVPFRQRLGIVDLTNGSRVRLRSGLEVAPHLLRWSKDSTKLMVWARDDDQPWNSGELIGVARDASYRVFGRGDLETQAAGSSIDNIQGVRADWIGANPILYGRRANADRFDWYRLSETEPPEVLTSGLSAPPSRLSAVTASAAFFLTSGALWRMDGAVTERISPTGTAVHEIAFGDTESPFRLLINTPPARNWVTGSLDDGSTATATDKGGVVQLASNPADGVVRVLASMSSAALVLRRSGLSETLSLRTRDVERDLDRINTEMDDVNLITPLAVPHLDVFGRQTESRLFLPEGGASAAKGLLIEVYPGSVDTGGWGGPMNMTYGLRAAVFAGAGYAVLSPSLPIDRPDGISVEAYVKGVDAAVDAALADFPDLPAGRMAVVGHSLGGFTALAIATRSRRYRSYVSWAGLSDMFAHWGEFSPVSRIVPEEGHTMRVQQGWVELKQGGMDGPPWNDPIGYVQNSPYLAADKIQDPVLLITADRDFVPMSESERMFSALYRLGRTARLVTYWGEDHMLWSPANIRDLYSEIFSWLDRTLFDEPREAGVLNRAAAGADPRLAPNLRTQQP